jgi:hypothetical protein
LAIGLSLGAAAAHAGAESAAPQATTTQAVAISQAGETVLIHFQGLSLSAIAPSADGMEAALSFRQPVAATLASELSKLTAAVSDASSGYDSLLLRARTASRFQTMPTRGGFVLSISPLDRGTDERRSAALDIRRLTLSGDTEAARDKVSRLRQTLPEDQELLRLDADIAYADHDYRKAAEAFAGLVSSNPLDEGLRENLRAARAETSPRIDSGVSTQKIEKADRQTHAFVSAEAPITPTASLRGRIDYVELDDNDVQMPDNTRQPFSGSRYGGEIDVLFDLGNRWNAGLLGFANEDSLGGGGLVAYRDASSSAELRVVYQEPSWDYPESIVANGTVNEAALKVTRSFEQAWFFNASVAVQQFTLYGVESAATNTAVEAGLQRTLFSDADNRVLIGYDFNGDFAGSVKDISDGGGGFFTLLPLGDRNVHAGSLRYEGHLTPELFTSIRAGYATDAEGQDGAIAGGELTWSPDIDLRLSLNAYYSGIPDRAGQTGSYMNTGLTFTKIFVPSGGQADGH